MRRRAAHRFRIVDRLYYFATVMPMLRAVPSMIRQA
jgi:hypothetical protein